MASVGLSVMWGWLRVAWGTTLRSEPALAMISRRSRRSSSMRVRIAAKSSAARGSVATSPFGPSLSLGQSSAPTGRFRLCFNVQVLPDCKPHACRGLVRAALYPFRVQTGVANPPGLDFLHPVGEYAGPSRSGRRIDPHRAHLSIPMVRRDTIARVTARGCTDWRRRHRPSARA